MHRIAHEVSGGLIVALPGPDEDHNPATSGDLATLLAGRADIPYDQRMQVARFMEDITASSTAGWYSVISLHGGGSPQAMKREIFRQYPIEERRELVERLLDRGVADSGSSGAPARQKQPGQCCAEGCQPTSPPTES
jgi:4-hydroxybutyryl-CoA dehydratase/vinylacetyl-CoA-Delta-isomerase